MHEDWYHEKPQTSAYRGAALQLPRWEPRLFRTLSCTFCSFLGASIFLPLETQTSTVSGWCGSNWFRLLFFCKPQEWSLQREVVCLTSSASNFARCRFMRLNDVIGYSCWFWNRSWHLAKHRRSITAKHHSVRYGKFTCELAARHFYQVCDALEYLHTQTPQIIHRQLQMAFSDHKDVGENLPEAYHASLW